jgi:putative ABC transport system ATP-binding protein
VLDGRRVLDGVTLAVADRGITVFVGPSGSGKTTLLRLLDRLEVPTEGTILFRGEPLDALDPLALRRRVGMVFQRPAPFPGTVRDNLLVADPAGDEPACGAALDAAGLGAPFLDRPADDLSGGETQRLCLARTLVTRPEVLLMDEPTSALDRGTRRHLEATARRMADGGVPVLWVTHDLDQAGRLADDRVVLVGGRVVTGDERERYLAAGGEDEDGEPPPEPSAEQRPPEQPRPEQPPERPADRAGEERSHG